MSIATLVLGESGTGKTASLRNLNPADTLLIQAVSKPLPFKTTNWTPISRENLEGSIAMTDDSDRIVKLMSKTRRKVIVLDDFQYVLANEFMRRNEEKGYDKFNDIGKHAWNILTAASALAEDVRVYILAHTQSDDIGRTKIKTIGKMLDEKITPEGLFTIVLRTHVVNGNYLFSTRNSGQDTVKSPMSMFEDDLVPNDLNDVDQRIVEFYDLKVAA